MGSSQSQAGPGIVFGGGDAAAPESGGDFEALFASGGCADGLVEYDCLDATGSFVFLMGVGRRNGNEKDGWCRGRCCSSDLEPPARDVIVVLSRYHQTVGVRKLLDFEDVCMAPEFFVRSGG